MASSVMEVISPSFATVSTPQTNELRELMAEVAILKKQISNLQATGWCRSNSRSKRRTTNGSVTLLEYAHLHAPSRATSAAGPTQSRLFYITDRASGLKFLIDTGAEVSVVSHSHTYTGKQKGPSLQAINNTSIPTYGTCSLTLDLGLRRSFRWVFIITDVSKAI